MFGNRLEDSLDNIGNVVVLEIIFLTPVADKRGCRVRPADFRLSASASFHQRILVSSELLDYQVRSGDRGATKDEDEAKPGAIRSSRVLKYAISEDGRLHAENYDRTVTEEFVSIRPGYRWRELVAWARVTASC